MNAVLAGFSFKASRTGAGIVVCPRIGPLIQWSVQRESEH